VILLKFGRKVIISGQAVFCPNFVSTPISAKLPIFQIYHTHFHSLGDWSQYSICWSHISLDVCEREWYTKCISHHIFSSIIAKISISLLKMRGKNESRMIWMKNIYGSKLIDALPNHCQFVPNQKFRRPYLNICLSVQTLKISIYLNVSKHHQISQISQISKPVIFFA
jgi:hypothetical protein